MGIKDLINKPQRGPGTKLLPSKLKKIRSDLREVAKAEKAGSHIPNVSALMRFFYSEYNEKVCHGTVKRLLDAAREEANGQDK